jgi:hypothetical protein
MCFICFKCTYEVVSESSGTVIVATASMKEAGGGEGKVILPQAYCISMPRGTAL